MKTLLKLTFILLLFVGITSCSEDDDSPDGPPPTGTVELAIDVVAGEDVTFTGTLNDELGLESITITYLDWGLAKVISLPEEPLTYTLNYSFTVPAGATPGDHSVVITVENTSGKTLDFTVVVTVAEPIAYTEMYATGGFAWWGYNAEHGYMMTVDPADANWFEIIVQAWSGGYDDIKFIGQLAWTPDNWGLVDQTNPSLGMINSEDSEGIILGATDNDNPAYFKVRFNPIELSYTSERLTPDIEVQDSMFIVGSGFTDYPDLDWNTEEAIPMTKSDWGEHIFEIYELSFSDAVSLKFIGQRDGWGPVDVGFDENYIVDVDAGTDGYQVLEPISWIPTASGDGTADLKFVNQAGTYTVMYDHYAKRAIIWKE